MPAPDDRIRLDLNSPEFQSAFFQLEADDLRQVVSALRRLQDLSWPALYRCTGFRWEAIERARAGKFYSLRLSQRIRAVAIRDGSFLRFISLHPEHDSTYRRR